MTKKQDCVEYARYKYNEPMPALQDVLDTMLAENPIERIRIFSGIPRFYYGSRQLRRVHANIRCKNGREIFRSKHVTNELLQAPVAQILFYEQQKHVRIGVFMPYGRHKDRTGTQNRTQPVPRTICNDGLWGDELPF